MITTYTPFPRWFRENEIQLRERYSASDEYEEKEFRGWAYERYLEDGE